MSDRTDSPVRLAVVVPAHNEQESLPRLLDALALALDGLVDRWSLIVVDDGSADGTFGVIEDLAAEDPRVLGIRLSRNFGHQAALACGIEHAEADVVITMDADLQHPPSRIPEMLESWREGHDVVTMVQTRHERRGVLKTVAAALFYRTFSRIAEIELAPGESDFRLLDERCVRALRTMPERRRFLRGQVRWIGFSRDAIEYEAPARTTGTPSYTTAHLARLASLGFTSFSSAPLRSGLWLGAGVACVAPLLLLAAWFLPLDARAIAVVGVAAALFVGASVLLCLGVLGVYVGALLEEVRARPTYLIAERVGRWEEAPGS